MGRERRKPLLESKGSVSPYWFSPDGKRLAFAEVAPDTGADVWTLPLDLSDPEHPKPGNPELFLRTPSNEYDPAFSPDGRWIAYSSQESGQPEVYVRPFPGGRPGMWQISTDAGVLWSMDLAPDGKRFAVFPRPEATGGQKGSVHVTVLLNFFDELRRRVPAGSK